MRNLIHLNVTQKCRLFKKYLQKEKQKEPRDLSGKNFNTPKPLQNDKVKSPSDMTLYMPALQKNRQEGRSEDNPYLPRITEDTPQPSPIDQISNFVEQMCMNVGAASDRGEPSQ